MLTKNNSVILEVTADEYELCVGLYENTRDLAVAKNRSIDCIKCAITRKAKSKDNTYFIKVYIGDKREEYENEL